MSPSEQSPRRRWRMLAPLALALILGAAWTGAWFYAAQRAESLIAAWIEREAQHGRAYACAERSVGGYPFRIEVRCAGLTAVMERDGVTLKAREVLALAQIYQPDLVIAEIAGPLAIAAGEESYRADWSLLQISVRGRPSAPQRISLVAERPRLERTGAGAGPVGQAARLEAHLRRSPGAAPNDPSFDLAAKIAGGTLAIVPALGERPIDGAATAVFRGVPDFAPKPLRQRLREWQAAGGRLEITDMRLRQGEALAVAKGAFGLSADGHIDGALELALAGLDRFASMLMGNGEAGRAQNALLIGLGMLGRTELEGKRALALPLRFKGGRISIGPVPIGRTAPVF